MQSFGLPAPVQSSNQCQHGKLVLNDDDDNKSANGFDLSVSCHKMLNYARVVFVKYYSEFIVESDLCFWGWG